MGAIEQVEPTEKKQRATINLSCPVFDFASADVADMLEVAREQAFGDAIDKAITLVSVGLFQNTQARDKMVADLRALREGKT